MSHFETPKPISVLLELRVADVHVAAGERADTIVNVRASDSSKRDDVTAAEQTRVEYADGRLLVKGPRRLWEWTSFRDGGSVDVDIELPAGSDLSGHTAAGGFRCTGSLGDCELKSGVGAISLDQTARVKLTTAGDIRLERATGDAELATATGDVRAGEIDGSAVIKNSNGDTRIGEVGGDLRVRRQTATSTSSARTARSTPRPPTATSASGASTVPRSSRKRQPGASRSGSPTGLPPGSTSRRPMATSTTASTPPRVPGVPTSRSKYGRGRDSGTSRSDARPCAATSCFREWGSMSDAVEVDEELISPPAR